MKRRDFLRIGLTATTISVFPFIQPQNDSNIEVGDLLFTPLFCGYDNPNHDYLVQFRVTGIEIREGKKVFIFVPEEKKEGIVSPLERHQEFLYIKDKIDHGVYVHYKDEVPKNHKENITKARTRHKSLLSLWDVDHLEKDYFFRMEKAKI